MDSADRATYVVVCRGPNCRERGGLQFRKKLAELLRNQSSTRLTGYACFGQCDFGPNVVFYPEGEFYGGLEPRQVVEHALGRPITSRPLAVADGDRQQHLRNIAELVTTLERDRTRVRRHWWWPF